MSHLNLLPPSRKDAFNFATQRRFALRVFLALLFILFVFDVLLVNALIFLNFSVHTAQALQESSELQAREEGLRSLKERIGRGKQWIVAAGPYLEKRRSVIADIAAIAKPIPEDIHLTSMLFDTASRKVSLSGFSPTRAAALTLEQNLRGNACVSELDFPYTIVVPERDISFHIRFTLSDPCQ